jgi:hypothetical protein
VAAFPDAANLKRQSRVPNPGIPKKPALVGTPNPRPDGLDAASDLKLANLFRDLSIASFFATGCNSLAPPLSGPTAAPPSPTNRLNAD